MEKKLDVTKKNSPFLKSSLAFNALLLGGFIWLWATDKIQWDGPKQQVASQCDVCTEDSSAYPPFNYLEVRTLQDMANKFKGPLSIPRRMVTQSNGNRVSDANSIWFSLDALKQFIWRIQKDTCGKKNCEGQPLELGIRIYYSRYPNFDSVDASGNLIYPDLKNVNRDYDALHTVFMIPTFDSSGYQKDFDPRYYDKENGCRPLTINPDGWPVGKPILALTPSNYTAQNHGGLCPPLQGCLGSAFQ
jgi:hypothetical protein